jgi:hypothetical protein
MSYATNPSRDQDRPVTSNSTSVSCHAASMSARNCPGIGNPNARNLNSTANVSNLSVTIMAAVGRHSLLSRRSFRFCSFRTNAPFGRPPFLSGGTGLSSQERKIGADKVVPRVPVATLFRLYHVLRLMPSFSHGLVGTGIRIAGAFLRLGAAVHAPDGSVACASPFGRACRR